MIKILLLISIGLVSIFAVLLYFQLSNRDCLNIPESEAVDMINRVFESKQNQASSNGYIFEHKLQNLRYSHEQFREMDTDSDLGYVELQYNKANKKALVAVIYSNCEIQWINGT